MELPSSIPGFMHTWLRVIVCCSTGCRASYSASVSAAGVDADACVGSNLDNVPCGLAEDRCRTEDVEFRRPRKP